MLKTIPALDIGGAPRTWIPACAGMTRWVREIGGDWGRARPYFPNKLMKLVLDPPA
jgi:hypothetical protein